MKLQLAEALMQEFALATGIAGGAPQRRYLWTDAFAVCNYLGLARRLGNAEYFELAKKLVKQVHQTLGRHREDDTRRGWISGLGEAEGERHPTQGGLRIGKPWPERRAHEALDPQLEWERDGQYFHYLTKWMHALRRVHAQTNDDRYRDWSIELAVAAHRAFTHPVEPGGAHRMVWKMSIDLRRPLVASMGQHDPLDGLVTSLELLSVRGVEGPARDALNSAITDYLQMCAGADWLTDDPLGLGGLLDAAARLAVCSGIEDACCNKIVAEILKSCEKCLPLVERILHSDLGRRPRMAFRELGLSIGLHAMRCAATSPALDHDAHALFQRLLKFGPLAAQVENWWSEPEHRARRAWSEHADINNVMLATALAPEGYLAT